MNYFSTSVRNMILESQVSFSNFANFFAFYFEKIW